MRELAIIIEALELALHAHGDLEVTLAGGATTGWIEVMPGSPFEAIIPYAITFADCPPGIFQLESEQKFYTRGVKTLSTDEMQLGIEAWFYVTDRDPLRMKITNLDAQPHTISITMWYLNVIKLEQLDIIRMVLWEYVARGSIAMAMKRGYAPPFEYIPEIVEFLKKKYEGF